MIVRVALCAAFALFATASLPGAEITADRNADGVAVKIDGKPFVQYWTRAGSKPVVWPIIGPTGQPMTRAYPMGKGENEREDHIHQRSLWFTHGNVNGVDFWGEPATYAKADAQAKARAEAKAKADAQARAKGKAVAKVDVKPPVKRRVGEIRHREFVEVRGGPQAVIATRDDWLDQDGKKMLEDQRRLVFAVAGTARQIDFDITLTASVGPVMFGDTKEGSFGVRTAETLNVDAKRGGQIVNAEGLKDKEAWGKRSSWVDYHGPVAGQQVGIAILNHPSSFRYPTYWHVRTYGLFAANPFGLADFTGKKTDNGQYLLPKGQSIRLRYRVLLHEGDEKSAKLAEAFADYVRCVK
jgi:hypothetical protein